MTADQGTRTWAIAGLRLRSRRRRGPAVVACLLLASCGAADTTTTEPNAARTAPTISVQGTLDVSAPFTAHGAFTDTISTLASAATCADAAKGFSQGGQVFDLPENPQDAKIPDTAGLTHAISIRFHVTGYHGPGAYSGASVVADGSTQLVFVDQFIYGTAHGGTIAVTVLPDGSGQAVMTGLTPAPFPTPQPTDPPSPGQTPAPPSPTPSPISAAAQPPLTMSMKWTCAQVRAPGPTQSLAVPPVTAVPPRRRPPRRRRPRRPRRRRRRSTDGRTSIRGRPRHRGPRHAAG